MSPPARIRVASVIRREAIDYGVGWSWPEEIDHLNIHRATLLAMKRALCALSVTPELVLVDGCFAPLTPCPSRCVIGGDRTVPQIQAASIIAKTMRDLWMQRYSRIEPVYGFNRHKGYPTREHRDSIRAIGVSAIHRRSFRLLESSDPPGCPFTDSL